MSGQTQKAAGPSPSLPRKSAARKSVFILLSILLPVVGLSCIEGVLRIGGFGGYPPTFKRIGQVATGTLFVTDTNGAASYFYASRSRAGAMFENALIDPKPPGTLRVFLCGESAMKGFPQPRALACTSFLQAMLEDCWPERRIEVINLATTAVASFPVLDMLREAINYQPDLVIIYCGNNEFFGAYGVASLHSAGSTPTAIGIQRRLRSLGLVQFFEKYTGVSKPSEDRTLMEIMMGKASIAADDPLRKAAARNLHAHTLAMIRLCRERNVPVIASTLAFNERDLAPLGGDASDGARQAFGAARDAFSRGDYATAAPAFEKAADLDTMPWRPPLVCQQAIRDAARDGGGVLCDVQKAFREASPGGCIGWELMDDHVHPSLAGQALMARVWLQSMTGLGGEIAVPQDRIASLPDWKAYAARLGANEYEAYGVAHTLRVLCDVPFIRTSNPDAYHRYDTMCREAEARWPPEEAQAAREWQKPQTHSGGIQRPISALIGRIKVAAMDHRAGERLYEVAARSVPPYSSLHVEYTYFMLAARERARAGLGEADRRLAADEIERAKVLLAHTGSTSGMPERFIGRLHQLREEFREAIPFLLTARGKLQGRDRLAADQALVVSYIQTAQHAAARDFLARQIQSNDQFAPIYQQLLDQVDKQVSRPSGANP